MRTETTRLFKDLLGLQGYLLERPDAEVALGDAPATEAASTLETPPEESSMNLFKSLWLLGGLQSIDSRIGDDEAPPFGPTYGNRLASEKAFGPSREARRDQRVAHDARKATRSGAQEQRVAC